VDDVPAVRTPSGRRRARPGKLDADKGYDSATNRAWLRRRGITARIARRGIESSTRLGRHRWRVERALSWLACYRRLAIRWDRGSERFFAFVLLACALVASTGSSPQRERNGILARAWPTHSYRVQTSPMLSYKTRISSLLNCKGHRLSAPS
jgi:transposase